MPLSWITPKGDLGLLTEREAIEITLQAESDNGVVTYSLIAGDLPAGLRFNNGIIAGAPAEVRIYTEYTFVVRANDTVDIKDRTFSLAVEGSDIPKWLTEEGFLQVGAGDNYFVLDNSRVDFQLEATDNDLSAGDTLSYYLIDSGGSLPPGLELTSAGRIVGFTDPVFSVLASNTLSGTYDTASYDALPLDKPEAQSNGFDSFLYDAVTFDYNEDTQVPRRLSKFYTFIVAVSDGVNEVRRPFRIWVVTEEFLQADNNLIQVDTNLFRADNSAFRVPFWVTASYLGLVRANNYVTVILETYDPPSLPGTIIYETLDVNDDGSASVLPPGLTLDNTTGNIAGVVPYQSAVKTNYKFTIRAINFPVNLANIDYNFRGTWSLVANYFQNDIVNFSGLPYIALQNHNGKIPTDEPSFWQQGVATADKTFNIDLIGEIESTIRFVSDSDLGTIVPNTISNKEIIANNLESNAQTKFEIVSGELPPGLTLISPGLITGKVKQYADDNGPGLTRFYSTVNDEKVFTTTFDEGNTTFDRVFRFTAKAIDFAGLREATKEFFLTVTDINDKTFANLYLVALQEKEKRLEWYNFITNNNIFPIDELYRYNDPNFGVRSQIRVLLFGGIESVDAVTYVQAMSRNHYNKRLRFGDLKSAVAKDPITQETLYEIIYVEVVDEFEKDGISISDTIELPNQIESKILVSYDAINISSDIPLVSDSDHQRIFPNSIKNMRDRIKQSGERYRDQLPLWMRTIQPNKSFEPGYVKCLEIAYVKPGNAEKIISRIRENEFDFKSIDFQSDRYLIDVLDGDFGNKYLAFPQRGEKLP